jgi:hypothetical protein
VEAGHQCSEVYRHEIRFTKIHSQKEIAMFHQMFHFTLGVGINLKLALFPTAPLLAQKQTVRTVRPPRGEEVGLGGILVFITGMLIGST